MVGDFLSIKIELDFKKLLPLLDYSRKLLTKFNITHLLLISLALHLFVMPFPQDGGMVFDEVHYIKATRAHLEGIGANPEHTPLVKVGMSVVFSIFGDYWFSWRMPIIISCMIAYIAFYYIARHFLDEKYALIATAFLCFDIMFFIHGTIFLLDMPAIMFGLVAMALFLHKRYKLSAVSMALAILCKEIALFFLLALTIYWFGTNTKKISLKSLKIPLTYFAIVALIGFSFMAVYDNVYKISTGSNISILVNNTVVNDQSGNPITTVITTTTETFQRYINNPISHLQHFLTYHGDYMKDLNITAGAFQKPWNWIAPFDINGILDHPVYFQVRVTSGEKVYDSISWRAQGSIPIWYSFWLVVPMAAYMLIKKETKEKNLSLFLLAWIFSTFGGFVVIELIKNCTGFNYYFIYTVPALCLGIPFVLKNLKISEKYKDIVLMFYMGTILIFFMYYFPVGLFR